MIGGVADALDIWTEAVLVEREDCAADDFHQGRNHQ